MPPGLRHSTRSFLLLSQRLANVFRAEDCFDSQSATIVHRAAHPCAFGCKDVRVLCVCSHPRVPFSAAAQLMRHQGPLAKSTDSAARQVDLGSDLSSAILTALCLSSPICKRKMTTWTIVPHSL